MQVGIPNPKIYCNNPGRKTRILDGRGRCKLEWRCFLWKDVLMFLSGMQRRFKQIGRKQTNQISCLFGKISTEIEIMFKVSTGLSNRYLKVCEFFIDLGDNIVPPWIESHFVGEIPTDESLTQGWVKLFKSAQIHVWNANCLTCSSNWDELKRFMCLKGTSEHFCYPMCEAVWNNGWNLASCRIANTGRLGP